MPTITIDEQKVEVDATDNLIDVALRLGVHLPHFCYHPGLSVDGNCRQCLVEVEGVPKPQIACNTPIKDGMVVRTKTPEIEEMRRGVLEFLLLNHPIDCPICDQAGECRLQEYYMAHGLYDARRNVEKVFKPKVVDLGPHVVFDAERCVLCTRCVRFCEEIAGVEELYVAQRGHKSEIVTFPGKELENAYSGNVVDICPVGALLNKNFRFKSRVWWLKQANSVCSSCSRGCNIRVDHHWNQIQRLVPRENQEVNQYWMCDRGRENFNWVNDGRVSEAAIGGDKVTLRQALDAWVSALEKYGEDFTVVLSPKLSNEDLLSLRRLFGEVHRAKKLVGGSLEPDQAEDEILRKADPHPNSWMLRALGLDGDVATAIGAASTRGLILIGDDPVAHEAKLAEAFGKYAFVCAALTNDGATARAVKSVGGVLLPLATHFEFAGSFTNFEGRVQRFEPALSLVGSALPAYRMVTAVAKSLGLEFWPHTEGDENEVLQARIWKQLSPGSTDFPHVSWDDVPRDGLVADWSPTANPRSTLQVGDRMGSGFVKS